jgi:hypothetical protein
LWLQTSIEIGFAGTFDCFTISYSICALSFT